MNIDKPEKDFQKELEEFISLAKANNEESWVIIDQKLPEFINNLIFLNWAKSNTNNADSGLRDLAATIFESSSVELKDDEINDLIKMLENNDYSGFRAACALAKRFEDELIKPFVNQIKGKLEDFVDDPDLNVSEIAKNYLKMIRE
jgi:hypothetical protein